jgi:hypothetical protein
MYVFIVPDCIVSLQFCFLPQLRRTRGVYCQIFPTKSLSLCTNMYYTTNVPACSHNVVEDHFNRETWKSRPTTLIDSPTLGTSALLEHLASNAPRYSAKKGASTSLSSSGRCVQTGSQPRCSLLTKPKNFQPCWLNSKYYIDLAIP